MIKLPAGHGDCKIEEDLIFTVKGKKHFGYYQGTAGIYAGYKYGFFYCSGKCKYSHSNKDWYHEGNLVESWYKAEEYEVQTAVGE